MLFLHQSNRLEQLLILLCKTLASKSADPLAAETVVVQNPGMARWVFQQIALKTGIAANLDFPLPATFIWNMLELMLPDLPDISPFSREVMTWRILAGVDELAGDPLLADLSRYLGDGSAQSKRLQLAEQISDLFDQYLVYRPDMLLDWERHKAEHWQMRLWQWLVMEDGRGPAGPERKTSGSARHRAHLIELFFDQLEQGRLRTDQLPGRICVFGLNSLPPVYVRLLAGMAGFTDIHLFHLSPCRQAWDDIVPRRDIARRKKAWLDCGLPEGTDLYTSGNPLLSSLGKVGRDFFQLLIQHEYLDNDRYEPPDQATLLGAVQADILDLHDRTSQPTPLARIDDSIRFHVCHSPMREVQVLHNRLLDLLQREPDLEPGDILVMAPDINRYGAAIGGVFGSAGDNMRIPWSLADRSRREEDRVIDGFLCLLDLPGSRCTSAEILDLLENPAIGPCFAIQPADLPRIRARISGAGIRWGLDREQCGNAGLPDLGIHTWSHGIDRMLLGHCLGEHETPWRGIIASATGAGSSQEWLGGLALFLRRLRLFTRACGEGHPPGQWTEILHNLVTDFFSDQEPHAEGCMFLRNCLRDFADQTELAGYRGDLTIGDIRHHFGGRLAGAGGGHAFLSGRVTFCNMVPMRSVPFKVVCLLGLNDADYPRQAHRPDFDLIASRPRPGDRNRRDDDRYLFLEAILSARRHLFIFWVGRDPRENTELPPSTVAAELRDYLDRGWRLAEEKSVAKALTTEHPLQPFSHQCFGTDPDKGQYGTLWFPDPAGRDQSTFFARPLAAREGEIIHLADLARFWKDPVRFVLNSRLDLRLGRQEAALPEEEPFALDSLTRYLLESGLLVHLDNKGDPARFCARAAADGLLPGFAGQHRHCRTLAAGAATLLARFRDKAGTPLPARPVDVEIRGYRISGLLGNLHDQGRAVLRPATHKGRDLFQLWIHHLVLCLVRPLDVRPVSIHVARDATLILAPVKEPEKELTRLVSLHLEGLCRPLHFFPDVSLALVQKDMRAARGIWFSSRYRRGAEDDPHYRLALQGQDPLDREFMELAALFHPVLDNLEIISHPEP